MTYHRFNAVCESLFLRIIAAQPTPAQRLDFATIAHAHGQITDAALATFQEEAARVSA